jgi:hypothetical protein
MNTQQTDLNTPWSIRFEQDGTEDIAVICDADGYDLARSDTFWLPQDGDPIPATLAAIRLMAAAPKLLEAAKATLTALELMLEMDAPATYSKAEWDVEPLMMLRQAIVEAEDFGSSFPL